MSESESIFGILPSRSVSTDEASLSITDACRLVRSGDLVLFSDNSWSASFITTTCSSRFSHIGIIYRRQHEKPLLLESVYHKGKDIDVTRLAPQSGVRLIDFETHLRHFNGKSVAIRLLITQRTLNVSTAMRKHMTSVIENVWDKTKGLPYETNVIDFLISRFPLIEKKIETMDRFFCSKLVAYCYMEAGLLDITLTPSSFLPDDFSETGEMPILFPTALSFPGFEPKISRLIKLSNELYINTRIL